MDDAPDPKLPALPQAPSAPPMFGQQQAGQKKKPKKQNMPPSFLGSEGMEANPTNTGQKTLLGQ